MPGTRCDAMRALRVRLSAPVMAAQNHSYFWTDTLLRLLQSVVGKVGFEMSIPPILAMFCILHVGADDKISMLRTWVELFLLLLANSMTARRCNAVSLSEGDVLPVGLPDS